MDTKSVVKSKTVWVSVIVTLAGLGAMIAPYNDFLHNVLGDHWFGIVTTVVGIVTGIARVLNSNLKLSGAQS